MPVQTVPSDIFEAKNVEALAIGLAANGRTAPTPFYTTVADRFPAFLSDYRKRTKARQLVPGTYWVWRDTAPLIVGLVISETPQGPVRPRYVESALVNLYHNAQREGLHKLAIAPFADPVDWPPLVRIIEQIFATASVDVTIHDFNSRRV